MEVLGAAAMDVEAGLCPTGYLAMAMRQFGPIGAKPGCLLVSMGRMGPYRPDLPGSSVGMGPLGPYGIAHA
jgi:hypothetical protein